MTRRKVIPWLGGLVLLTVIGCYPYYYGHHHYPHGAVVVEAPPPPMVEEIPPPPDDTVVWADGYWQWNSVRYVWIPGRYRRPPRHGVHWYRGGYVRTPRGFVFVRGRWAGPRYRSRHRYVHPHRRYHRGRHHRRHRR